MSQQPRMTKRLLDVVEVVGELQRRGYHVEHVEVASTLTRPVIQVSPGAGCRELAGQRTAERIGHVVHHRMEATSQRVSRPVEARMTAAVQTEIPTIADLRRLGTRALATYIRGLWDQRTHEVQNELAHVDRACLNANLDRWIEKQKEHLAEMNEHNDDFSTRGRALFWTARDQFDRAGVEVDRAFRRLQEPQTTSAFAELSTESPPKKPTARSKKKNTQP